MRLFLDSNVFLYAVGVESPHRAPCRALLDKVARRQVDATTSSEVIQEIVHVAARRGRREEAAHLAEGVASLFPDLLPVTGSDVVAAARLVVRHPHLDMRDAVHVATMRGHNISVIVSADRDFRGIPGIKRLKPGALR